MKQTSKENVAEVGFEPTTSGLQIERCTKCDGATCMVSWRISKVFVKRSANELCDCDIGSSVNMFVKNMQDLNYLFLNSSWNENKIEACLLKKSKSTGFGWSMKLKSRFVANFFWVKLILMWRSAARLLLLKTVLAID